MNNKMIEELIIVHEKVVNILVETAESDWVDAKILTILSSTTDSHILSCVTMNPRTPSKILDRIIKGYCGLGGSDEETRIHIVNNPALKLQVLKNIIATDCSERVRQAATEAVKRRAQKNKAK